MYSNTNGSAIRSAARNYRTSARAFIAVSTAAFIAVMATREAAFVNALDFGAKPGTDSTAAIQAAIDSVGSNGDTIYLPSGAYGISAPLVISNKRGVRLLGDGVYATALVPTAALAGRAVVQFVNGQNATVESLTIYGNTGSAPAAAIESEVTAGAVSTHLTVRNVTLGSLSSNSLVDGIKYVDTGGTDSSNDKGFFENVEVINYTHAAFSFTHPSSGDHTIIGGNLMNGEIGVYSEGGSFKIVGTHFNINDVNFDLENSSDPSSGYQHAVLITNISSEGNSALMRTGTDPVFVTMTGVDHKFSPANRPVVSFSNPGILFVSNSHMFMLDVKANMEFTGGVHQMINLSNNFFDVVGVTLHGGKLISQNNCWRANPALAVTLKGAYTEKDVCGIFKLAKVVR
jgi:hypothetical protein